MRTEKIIIDGLSLRVGHSSKESDNPPLLLLSGIGAPIEACLPLAAALESTTIVTLDLPGLGESDNPKLPLRMPQLADLLAKLLDYYQLDQIDLLGISWGGALAQQFCRSHPRRVRKLILAATSPGVVMFPGRPIDLLEMIQPLAPLSLLKGPLRWLRPERKQVVQEPLPAGLTIDGRPYQGWQTDSSSMLYQLFAISGWSSILWLRKIHQPCLILSGESDPIVPPANARLLAACLRRSESVTLPGDHLFMLQQPTKTARLIQRFIEKTTNN